MSYVGRVNQKSSDIRRFDVTSSTSATHTLTWVAPNEQSLIVTINGVKQQEDAYSVSGTTLTLTDALIATDKLEVIGINDLGTTITPAQNSITNDMVSSTAAIAQSKLATLAIDTSEIADDAVTADKLANSINTEIAANTAKVTNATHTGDVTGATALTIAADAVDIAMLSATGTADATTFLRGDNAWATAGGDNTPSFFVTGSGNQAIANETWTKVAWSTTSATEEWDTDSAFASDKFTVPSGEAGKYLFSFGGLMDEMDTNESWNMDLYVNGSEHTGGNSLGRVQVRSFNTNLGTFGNSTIALDLAVADYVEVYFYHNEGGTNNLQLNRSFFQGFKLIGV